MHFFKAAIVAFLSVACASAVAIPAPAGEAADNTLKPISDATCGIIIFGFCLREGVNGAPPSATPVPAGVATDNTLKPISDANCGIIIFGFCLHEGTNGAPPSFTRVEGA